MGLSDVRIYPIGQDLYEFIFAAYEITSFNFFHDFIGIRFIRIVLEPKTSGLPNIV